MKKFLCLALCFCLICLLGLAGCGGQEATPLEGEFTLYEDASGNTVVIDKDGSVIGSTANGDTIKINDDGSVTITDKDGNSTLLAADSVTDTTSDTADVTKSDTTGMDFGFDESDTNAADASSGTAVDISSVTTGSSAAGDTISITTSGTYTLTGTKTDTMVLVDASGAEVNIILNGVTINNSLGPAIYVREAKKVTVTLAKGSKNTLSDGASYNVTDNGSTLDAAIFSRSDLTVNGEGSLELTGRLLHGIVSKDDLVISSGTLKVISAGDAIVGKDCVKINSGAITLSAGTDGICANNTEDTSKGYIYLYGGKLNITAGNDGIQAETVLNIENADLTIVSGGGSSGSLSSSTESFKGLKAGSDIYITGGSFNINSKDDGIHSNGTVTISGGTYTVSSGDDGVHADTDLGISGSSTKLTVSKSYEGIEATNIVIAGGNVSVTASDDGLNAAGGSDTASSAPARPGQNNFSSSTGKIAISGGTLYINAAGDGMDANGTLSVTGGSITVSGANRGDTAILDFDSSGIISGGTFIGTGASGMTQNFSSTSTQGVIMVTVGNQSAGSKVTLTDSSGKTVISHTTDQDYSCVILSHASIKSGGTYTLTAGGYTTTITMSSTVYGSSGGMGGGGGHGPGGRR